jgi:L-ascorbate metabolism protein UlaG (beta-lactamase superfamily)
VAAPHTWSFPIMRSIRTLALAATLLAAYAVPAATAGEIKIAWYGQSFFQIVTPKGTKIILDPHNIEAYRIAPIKADLVLMSHMHNDHNQVEGVIENAKTVKQFNALKKTGPNALLFDWNLIDEKFQDVRFFDVATYHDSSNGMSRGKNGCWVLDVDGIRIAHLGDLGHKLNKAQLKKFGKVDVVMVPAGGVYTLNGIEAYAVAKQLEPTRYIIPMHYGTVVYDDLLPLKYFTDEAKDNSTPIDTLKVKEWLKIDTKAAAPKKPRVAILSYVGPGMNEIKLKDKDKKKDDKKDKDEK